MKVDCAYDKLVSIDELVCHKDNPNKHGKRQIELLAKIINYQGWRHPIIVSNRSGFIVAGHGRLEAARLLGYKEVPIDTQDFEDEAAEYSFLIADNKISELAEHDDQLMIDKILSDFPDIDTELLGLDDFNLPNVDPDKDAIEDEVPEVTESISKLGDLYELGEHRLLCGDSTDKATVERLMGGEKADMVFTDPPYGINLDTNYERFGGSNAKSDLARHDKKYREVKNDDKDFSPDALLSFYDYCEEIFIWGGQYFANKLPKNNWIVWDKKTTESMDKMYSGDFEICWSKFKHKNTMCRVLWSGVLGHSSKHDGQNKMHPTQKPIKLIDFFFDKWGKDKTKIVDLYGGSGSTLIACEKTKRKCYMLELDPHYIDVIVSRWVKYTGNTAIKRNGEPMEWPIQHNAT